MAVVLLGPPGSGKGTQAKRYASATGDFHVSTGDLLRSEISSKTDLGLKIKSYTDAGKLLPDRMMTSLLEAKLNSLDGKKGVIFDGYPRTIVQASELDRILKKLNSTLDVVVYLDVAEEEVTKRMLSRVQCGGCKSIFSKRDFAKDDQKCPNCGGVLAKRTDDGIEAVTKRLSEYKRETSALIDYYKKSGILRVIDGSMSPDVVAHQIFEVLEVAV